MRPTVGLAGVLVALAVGWTPTPVQAAQIVVTNSVECIDIPQQQTVDGTPVSRFNCHGSPNQQWTIANGQIVGIGGKCLDVAGASAQDHATLIIATCTSSPSQQWSVQ